MLHQFSNNAETTLATAFADVVDTSMVVTGDPTAEGTVDAFLGSGQLATLTHATFPGEYEVVLITDRVGLNFTVERSYEGTAQVWPAGTLVSARITAKMLGRFLQHDPQTGLVLAPEAGLGFVLGQGAASGDARASSALVIGGRSRIADGIQLSGWSTLQLLPSQSGASGFDRNMAYESVGGSIPVDLGVAMTWNDLGGYFRGSVVQPTTPDGYQYWLDVTDVENYYSPGVGATEPTWNNAGATPVTNGNWYPTALPVDIATGDVRNILVTEVGFIAHKYSASSPPVVDIGTEAAPTRFANAVSLTQITGDGCVHRIPLTTGGAMVKDEGLRFRVNTAASGGRCVGRFYWRGIFIETAEAL